ncbi:putative PPE family protein PPE16 [Dissostichus eleginoides]|uniref:PPE family protein PPE16 n=2 Tax=Dissostichus eleginoides TaxID=100907 RepID=A0AAD9AZH6_DISEL|nr:putative PPE family protein PPE16 [Dissostichus eleginoides]
MNFFWVFIFSGGDISNASNCASVFSPAVSPLLGIYLLGIYLLGTYLLGTYLLGTYLLGTYLLGIYLLGIYLLGTYLLGTYLLGTYLLGIYLLGTYLLGIYLLGTYLLGIYLLGIYLLGIYLLGTYLLGIYLLGIYTGKHRQKVTLPFKLVGMDLIGKLAMTKDGYQYVCVMTDYMTKGPQAYSLKTQSAEEETRCILNILYQFEAPKRILTDQGRECVNAISVF